MHFSRTVETQRHWRRSGVFIINFKHTSHLFLVFLLIILNKCFGNKSFWHQLARRSSGLTSITSFQSLLKGEGVEIVHIYTYTYIYIYIYIYTYIYIYIYHNFKFHVCLRWSGELFQSSGHYLLDDREHTWNLKLWNI